MKVDLSKVELKDIDGNVIKDAKFYKTIADLLYGKARSLDLVEIARAINKGEEVEMAASHIKEMRQLVENPESKIFTFARKAFSDYMDTLTEKKKDK